MVFRYEASILGEPHLWKATAESSGSQKRNTSEAPVQLVTGLAVPAQAWISSVTNSTGETIESWH